ncbi:MAG: hypothetical protein K6C40_16115 [Thermoguttaceae bacterium]|nr:hypothetical protein [Thermoguttaceae bacterium]
MKHFIFAPIFSLLIICSTAFAQVGESLDQDSLPEKYVSTVLTPQNIRILKIDYPCDVHPTASVEVRILDDKTVKDPTKTAPVFLQSRWMDRSDLRNIRLKDAIDDCYLGDDDDMLLKTLRFGDPEAKLSVLGWIGAFGVRDTVVRVKMKNTKTGEEETTLVFPNASRTTVGKMPTKTDPFSTHAFGFDLVGEEFDLPCNIMVWVLRGEKVLLQEIIHWDGRMENPYERQGIFVRHDPGENKKDDFFDDADDGDDDADAGDDDDDDDADAGDDDDDDDDDDDSGDDDDDDDEEE